MVRTTTPTKKNKPQRTIFNGNGNGKKKSTGQPTKLTKVKDKLLEAIRQGNYYEAACGYAGISYQTFRNWQLWGEEQGEGPYFEFFEDLKKAEQMAEVELVRKWQAAMPESWQAIATFMERRYPERWGRKQALELTGREGGPVQVEHEDKTLRELLKGNGGEFISVVRRATFKGEESTGGSGSIELDSPLQENRLKALQD